MECKTAVSRSRLPGLDWALNPYRGCSHRCAYCYAQDVTRFEMGRPWGEDIEVKVNIVSRLKKELDKGPQGVFGVGTVTDPYQPIEKEYELTRGCLAVLRRGGASVSILTKSDLVLRDLDLLKGWEGAEVGVSIGCADPELASIIEPGAPAPGRRFDAIRRLVDSSVQTYLMAAPIIQGVADSELALKSLVEKAHDAGVTRVMWDKFNPKPLASARLRKSLERQGTRWDPAGDSTAMERTRAVLREECGATGIDLSEAF